MLQTRCRWAALLLSTSFYLQSCASGKLVIEEEGTKVNRPPVRVLSSTPILPDDLSADLDTASFLQTLSLESYDRLAVLSETYTPIHPALYTAEPIVPAERPEPPPRIRRDAYWNSWVERSNRKASAQPAFEQVQILEQDSDYRIFLDLSGLKYREPAVASGLGTPSAATFIRNLALQQDLESTTVTVLMVPDSRLFASPGGKIQELKIDLKKTRRWLTAPSVGVPDPWAARKGQDSLPDFLFGSVSFELKTLANQGLGFVAFSFWSQGRPIGEFPVALCVGDQDSALDLCRPELGPASVQSPWSAVNVPLEKTDVPDASLHFVDMPGGPIGVFWCGECPEPGYKAWRLDQSLPELSSAIQQSILGNVDGLKNLDQWRLSGRVLFQSLFPGYPRRGERNELEEDRRSARVAFARFLVSRLQQGGKLPSGKVFVRFAVQPGVPDGRIPLGIINADEVFRLAEIQVPPSLDRDVFLGFRFLVESPLPIQSFAQSEKCISRWFMALPMGKDKDTDLENAGSRLINKIRTWQDDDRPEKVFLDMIAFGDWLSTEEEQSASALVVLSHHDPVKNKLFFSQDGPGVVPLGVRRNFSEASLVVLDGCKTGLSGLGNFPEAFNQKGFSTEIVTGTNADPFLAGDFLDCLGEMVSQDADPAGRLVSDIFFDTLGCLGKRRETADAEPYGPNALTYLLLGNGNLRLCAPVRESTK